MKQYSQEATGIKIQRTIEEVKQWNDEDVYTFAIRVQRIVREALPRTDYALSNDSAEYECRTRRTNEKLRTTHAGTIRARTATGN